MKLSLGTTGSLLGFSFTYFLNFILIYTYAWRNKLIEKFDYRVCWIEIAGLLDIAEYLKYGIPSAFVICLEWWCFEIINVYAGWINVESLDASIGISSFINFITMIPSGISESVAISVGNSLGAGKPFKSIMIIKANLIFTSLLGLVFTILIFCFWYTIASIYSNSKDVIELMAHALPCYAIYITFDYS